MAIVFYELFFVLYVVALTVASVLILINISHQPKEFVWLVIACCFSILCDVAGMIMVLSGMNPNITGHIYWLFATVPLSLFFFYSIAWKGLLKPIIFLNIIYFAFALVNLLFIQTISLNSYSNIIHSFIILFYCIVFYYKLLKELPAQQLQQLPSFWIISGFFFSYAGKMVIYTVTHFLIHFEKDNMIVVWSFHNFLSLLGNAIIAYGAWLNFKQIRTSLPVA